MTVATVDAKIIARVRALEGDMTVRRALPSPHLGSVGPFVFLDQMGPVPFDPGKGMDVRPHPHIGLAAVTYLFSGAVLHRDSLGYDQVIRPGDVNWMTAGRGIVHSERTESTVRASGGTMFGVQAWLALPASHEEHEPRFDHHPSSTLPVLDRPGVQTKVLAGEVEGRRSPVRFPVEVVYLDVSAESGARIDLARCGTELAVYVATGAIEMGSERYAVGDLCRLGDGGDLGATALTRSRFLVLGGAPLDGPRYMYWNFVSSRPERIEQAKADWRRGRFEPVVGDDDRVPLPGDPRVPSRSTIIRPRGHERG